MNDPTQNVTAKPRILVVEDEPADVALLQRAFSACGMAVDLTFVGDGEAAIRSVRAARPDLLILDLNLPRLSGAEVLTTLRKDKGFKTLPVVIFSSSRSDAEVDQCYLMAANCYIEKPNDLERLKEVVSELMRFWFGTVTLPPRDE